MNGEIKELCQQIIDLVHPKRIILFGSRARNDHSENSDYDLLIIMPDGIHRRKTAQLLYTSISNIKTPYDLVIASESDYINNASNIGLVYKSIHQDGIELYAA